MNNLNCSNPKIKFLPLYVVMFLKQHVLMKKDYRTEAIIFFIIIGLLYYLFFLSTTPNKATKDNNPIDAEPLHPFFVGF